VLSAHNGMSFSSYFTDLRYRAAKCLLPRNSGERIPIFSARSGYHFAPDYAVSGFLKLPDIRDLQPFGAIARAAVRSGRTCLYYNRLHTLYAGIANAVRINPDECVAVEVGVFRGGGSRFMAEAMIALGAKSPDLFCFDTFEGHNEADISPTNDRVDKHTSQTFADTSFESVREFLSGYSFVSLHKGRFEQNCGCLEGSSIGFAHIDVDLHKPIFHALEFLEHRLLPGAMVVVDDYRFATCPGVEQAVSEFLATPRSLVGLPLLTGQFVLIKAKD